MDISDITLKKFKKLCALVFSLHVCLCEGVRTPETGVTIWSYHVGAGN